MIGMMSMWSDDMNGDEFMMDEDGKYIKFKQLIQLIISSIIYYIKGFI